MACNKIYIDSDTLYQITGLKDVVTDVEINDATITVQLFKSSVDVQIGIDITMTAVGTDGDYWCVIPSTNTIDPNDTYYLIATIEASTYTVKKKIFLTSEWSN